MGHGRLRVMLPVLFSIDKISVSSFGVFLALGFMFGVFLVWRLSRAWDLDEEKILDLTLLTFLGGLLGARIYYGLEHLPYFSQNPLNFLLFNKVPGFSFWGAFLGGWLTLYYFAKRKKVDFWQVGDIAAVGFLGGLIFSSFGCFLGGCNIGVQSNLFFSVPIVGIVGKRFPVQILEGFLLVLAFLNLWSKSTRFHPRGKMLGLSLIYIGSVNLLMEPLREFRDEGLFLSLILICLGINIFYKKTSRSLRGDLKGLLIFIKKFFTDSLTRKHAIVAVRKYWYNQKTLISWKFRNLKKNLRRLNVRFSYKNNKLH